MKSPSTRLVLLTTFLLSLTAQAATCPQPLKISMAESWPPAIHKLIEGFRQPFKDIGCEIVFKKIPLSRSLLMVSKGELDGDTFRIDGLGSDLPHLIRVQTPMARLKYYLYKKRGAPLDLEQPSSLSGRKTCLTLGNRLRSQVAKELHLEVIEAANTFQCLKMLANGRVDVFLGPTIEVQDPTLKEYNESLARSSKPYVTANLYIYLNDRHEKIARELEPLMKKYLVTDAL
ncbi:hypothetical protein HW988_05045 [Bdellovibrio sp. KM01]|nr:hypothetical protein HW988_05045 [Bdellovibrio sp. KM01]